MKLFKSILCIVGPAIACQNIPMDGISPRPISGIFMLNDFLFYLKGGEHRTKADEVRPASPGFNLQG